MFLFYSENRFILRGDLLYVFPCVILFLCFSVLLVLRLPHLGKRELILVLSYVCSVCACLNLSVSSSSWSLGRAAVCDCGTPWTFLLPFLTFHAIVSLGKIRNQNLKNLPACLAFNRLCQEKKNDPYCM